MSGVALIALAAVALVSVFSAAIWQRSVRSALTDPRRDPARRRISSARALALSELISRPGGDPIAVVEEGLALCAVDRHLWWRGGIRSLSPWLEALPDSDDGRALRAIARARLGEIEEASALIVSLPGDHWRACLVRALLYEIAGDAERAESALVAALQLAPGAKKPPIERDLEILRRQTGRKPSPHHLLWESGARRVL